MVTLNKLTIVMCEGQHDIAFINRILKVSGFKDYKEKIKDYLEPLNKLIIKEFEKSKFEDRKIGFSQNYKIPSVSLVKNANIVLFHDMGGEGKRSERKTLMEKYKILVSGEDDFTTSFGISLRFIIILDADDKGISERLKEIKEEYLLEKLEQGIVEKKDEIEYLAYVFSKSSSDKGDLEDILIELINKNENKLLDSSSTFIADNCLEEERTKEYICSFEKECYTGPSKFKEKKSKISIAGQMQFSGMSNAVIINKTDYIKKKDLLEHEKCLEILNLFQ